MNRTFRKIRTERRRGGFTLLELLAVVVILGIISAVILHRSTVTSNYAREKVIEHGLVTINSAIERYRIAEGSWPTAIADLDTDYLPGGAPTPPPGASGTFGIDNLTHRATYTP
jgi:prepilin-type N-terminal cleavage/methylation domain-containing protein